MQKLAFLMVFLLSWSATGCSGDDQSPGKASSEDTAPKVSQHSSKEPPDKAVVSYVAAIASNDVVRLRKAERASADGSLAEAYAQNQADQQQATIDGGQPPDAPGHVTHRGGGYRACYKGKKGARTCYTYGDFKVNAHGELASFNIDGRTLRGRISTGNGSSTGTSLATVTFLSAYITQGGDLVVAVNVKTKARSINFDTATSYRAPDGRQRVLATQSGPTEITPRSLATTAFYFTGPVKFGGAMTLKMFPAKGDYVGATAVIKIR